MPPKAGGGVPSSQARLSGGCQSGAGPRGALRAATGAAAWSGGYGSKRGDPAPVLVRPALPGPPLGGKPAAPAGTTASPVPNSYTRPGLGLERARPGVPGRASRAWGHGHGGASVLLGRFLLCPDDTLLRAAGEEGDRRPPVAPGEREEPASLFPGRRGRRPGEAEPDCADSGLPLQETLV